MGEVIRKKKLSDPRQGGLGGGSAASRAGVGAESMLPPFKEEQILDWFIQLALAMRYIHSKKILHRDIKACNVFLDADNRVKLGQ